MDTFEYIQKNVLPYRIKTANKVTGVSTIPSNVALESSEKITLETTTHLFYPLVADDNIGYNSTVFDDDDRNPSSSASGVYGFDYEAQPPNTNIDPSTGASLDINDVNGLVANTIVTTVLFNNIT